MSFFVAALSRTGNDLPQALRSRLLANLSRHPGEKIESFGAGRWLLGKVDVGAFQCKGSFVTPDGATFVMAGEPLLSGPLAAGCRNREDEGSRLFQSLRGGRTDVLEAATGSFCGAYYEPRDDSLTLVADKMGLRSLYYVETPEYVVAATAMRILEAAEVVATGIDLRGTYETAAFGFPLADRTCYENVRAISPAQRVRVTRTALTREAYFRWDRRGRESEPEAALIERLVRAFDASVVRRLRSDTSVLSFLSGGLDSRSIVAALRERGVEVHSINFAPAQTQDRVFAALIAEALSCRHFQLDVPVSRTVNAYRQEHLRGWVANLVKGRPRPERPGCIWSGDGGSVGMGHVYMDAETVGLLECGDLEGGVQSFLRHNRLPGAANGVMNKELRQRTHDWHAEGVRAEFTAQDRALDGRTLYLFLLLNDQRRHLSQHLENLDSHRFELHVPFFDSDLLEVVVRAPVAAFLGHRLYYRWLEALSPTAAAVPWQAYPNHEPCPVPFLEPLRYQWRKDYFGATEERKLSRAQGRAGLRLLLQRAFPGHLIDRGNFAAAVAYSMFGSSRYAHLTRVGSTFARAWLHAKPRAMR